MKYIVAALVALALTLSVATSSAYVTTTTTISTYGPSSVSHKVRFVAPNSLALQNLQATFSSLYLIQSSHIADTFSSNTSLTVVANPEYVTSGTDYSEQLYTSDANYVASSKFLVVGEKADVMTSQSLSTGEIAHNVRARVSGLVASGIVEYTPVSQVQSYVLSRGRDCWLAMQARLTS